MMNVEGFLEQKNISAKNISRLRELCESPDEVVRRSAELVLEVALIKPQRRKRWQYLYEKRPELFARLIETGFLLECGEDPETDTPPEGQRRAGAGTPSP